MDYLDTYTWLLDKLNGYSKIAKISVSGMVCFLVGSRGRIQVVYYLETWIDGLKYVPYFILVIVVQVSQVKAGTSALQTTPTFTLKLEHE